MPDTSPANVARVLRECAFYADTLAYDPKLVFKIAPDKDRALAIAGDISRLATAVAAQPYESARLVAAMRRALTCGDPYGPIEEALAGIPEPLNSALFDPLPWYERIEMAQCGIDAHWKKQGWAGLQFERGQIALLDIILRAAFPELAPKE